MNGQSTRINHLNRMKIAALFFGGIVVAGAGAATPAAVTREAFTVQLKVSETGLSGIERTFSQIQAAKSADARDALAPGFEEQQAVYARNMLAQYTTALDQADQFVKSKGKTGSVELLDTFESVAKRHEERLKALTADGERLKPGGAISWFYTAPARSAALAGTVLDYIGGMIIPQAHAAIAYRVYSACRNNGNSVACAKAVAIGVIDGNAARNTYNACWESKEKVRPKSWRAVLRAGCVAALVARLA